MTHTNIRRAVKITSLCDCLGFRKFIMVPDVYIINPRGKVVLDQPSSVTGHGPGLIDPVHIVGEWTGNLPIRKYYYILVASRNEWAGGSIGRVRGIGLTGAFLSLPLVVNTTGSYRIEISWK